MLSPSGDDCQHKITFQANIFTGCPSLCLPPPRETPGKHGRKIHEGRNQPQAFCQRLAFYPRFAKDLPESRTMRRFFQEARPISVGGFTCKNDTIGFNRNWFYVLVRWRGLRFLSGAGARVRAVWAITCRVFSEERFSHVHPAVLPVFVRSHLSALVGGIVGGGERFSGGRRRASRGRNR